MANLKTNYLGLELESPIIAGSSDLTSNIEGVLKIEKAGAGAVVLKSLFEEQILLDTYKNINSSTNHDYPEALDYIREYTKINTVDKYLSLIKEAKEKCRIPIIASINCCTAGQWAYFTKKVQEAGADAIELNVFLSPSDVNKNSDEYEKIYFDIIAEVKKYSTIPISLKISWYFTGLAHFIQKISWTGIKGLVLFNRFYQPDIDIDNFKVISTHIYSHQNEYTNSLRWIGIMYDKINIDLCASTGIHDGKTAIKMLLAGASTVQVCSVVYQQGPEIISKINSEIKEWMKKYQYNSIKEFKGKMSFANIDNPAAYERVQFMKYHAKI